VIEQKARNRALATKGVMLEVPKAYQEKVKGLGGEPAKPAQLSGADKQALDWANANPSDPRAAAIKKKLGM
jgi:hypothetical protein